MMRWSGASSDQCAGLVMISEKRSVRPCFYFLQVLGMILKMVE